MAEHSKKACSCKGKAKKNCTINRRQFLFASGATAFTVMVTVRSGKGHAEQVPALVSTYPRKHIGKLSEMHQDVPVEFSYPDEGDYSTSILVKTGVECGGGVGQQRDLVAFNMTCTHQGGDMYESYKPEHKVLGPCPLHLSTYDLTRHGILVSGQAYQSLPQVLLELDGDDIYAVGMFGLIYGRYDNLAS
ncbi:arsenate reductase (azurin) small subunit [Rhodobacteraceae bacterium RKSG542]|uniref:arsenate reductase (azurin) small subunit n=1 Tax=Pseudovibrio flavus TaxID=2529854 RepID=UPI0012BB82F8|nr:arsenate reductase (azurin) small subunit [Pseudovibrio flavus]MTI16014.1 arsenate reductase (azurin) small subunit [Pseudovibrio flavus]